MKEQQEDKEKQEKGAREIEMKYQAEINEFIISLWSIFLEEV